MSKKLTLNAPNCMLLVNEYGVDINGKGLEGILRDNLPNSKDFKSVPANVSLSIELLDTNLSIEKEGFEEAPKNLREASNQEVELEKEDRF